MPFFKLVPSLLLINIILCMIVMTTAHNPFGHQGYQDYVDGRSQNFPPPQQQPGKQVFDFIVVGGGNGGGIVAARLSKIFSVLVLDSGGIPPGDIYIPRHASSISQRPDINYHYRSIQQRHAGLQQGGFIPVTAGKMLGGGTSHNGLIWTRGSAAGYDEWAEITGDSSWKYENILKYFKKIENYQGTFGYNGQHGRDGPVDINEDSFTPGGQNWLAAGQELGYQVKDTNGPLTVGFGPTAFTKRAGRRVTTYTAYLRPALERGGHRLKISTFSTVLRILFHNKKAIGVEYQRKGSFYSVFASKEIILSAGTYASPIILIKSGVGPKDQLEAGGVDPIIHLPVGHNLIDHPKLDFRFLVNDSRFSWYLYENLTHNDVQLYSSRGEGPLSASDQQMEAHILSSRLKMAVPQPTNFFPKFSTNWRDPSKWPDLLVSYTPFGPAPNSLYCTIGNYRPRSRGVLRVNFTANKMDENNWPIIDFNYYDDESDLDVMVDGIYFCLKLIEETESFKKIGAQILKGVYAPCQKLPYRSKEYWKCYIRHKTRTGYHSVGTCRMGAKNDRDAVVDSKFRVIGVKNLRVVDASIMPTIINANTMAATYMIGEKGADVILREYLGYSGYSL